MVVAFPVLMFISMIEFIVILEASDISKRGILDFLNPISNYKTWTSMNWFGVIFWTLFFNLICPVFSVCYWFWKLCTVGRKN